MGSFTQVAAVAFLFFCTKEFLQRFKVIHVVFLPSWRVKNRRGCAVACT